MHPASGKGIAEEDLADFDAPRVNIWGSFLGTLKTQKKNTDHCVVSAPPAAITNTFKSICICAAYLYVFKPVACAGSAGAAYKSGKAERAREWPGGSAEGRSYADPRGSARGNSRCLSSLKPDGAASPVSDNATPITTPLKTRLRKRSAEPAFCSDALLVHVKLHHSCRSAAAGHLRAHTDRRRRRSQYARNAVRVQFRPLKAPVLLLSSGLVAM